MAKDRLVINGEPGESDYFTIAWLLVDDGEFGGQVGEGWNDARRTNLDALTGEDWETAATEYEAAAAAKMLRAVRGAGREWQFASHKDARAALKLIKAGVAARRANRPMPEWAQQAIAHGWSAPKGWAP